MVYPYGGLVFYRNDGKGELSISCGTFLTDQMPIAVEALSRSTCIDTDSGAQSTVCMVQPLCFKGSSSIRSTIHEYLLRNGKSVNMVRSIVSRHFTSGLKKNILANGIAMIVIR